MLLHNLMSSEKVIEIIKWDQATSNQSLIEQKLFIYIK